MTVEAESENATSVANNESSDREGGASRSKEEMLADKLMEQIEKSAKYRQANAEYKNRIMELEAQAQRAAELEEQVSKLTLSHRQDLAMARLEALATKEGLVDPDDLKLIDLSQVKYDENGRAQNLGEIMASFKEAKPHKFGSTATSSVEKAPRPASPQKGNSAKDMSPEEFARWTKQFGL